MGISQLQGFGGGARITSSSRRIAATGIAVTTLALGFAIPARADDGAPPTDVPTVPADATVTAPAAPDVSAAVAQVGAANVNVSIRVGSPGDNGQVTQTVSSAATTAAEITAQSASSGAAPQTEASVAQAAPSNVDLSVRVASPGADGAVTQTIEAAAAAQTQYQEPATQYQPQAPTAASTSSPTPTIQASQPSAPSPTTSSTLPTVWTWNWTWTCGDTTDPGIANAVDTGVQGWVWTWNLGGICGDSVASPSNISPITLPESGLDILPVVPPTPPSLPAAPSIVAPTPPTQLAEPPPVVIAPFPMPEELTPVGTAGITSMVPPELDALSLSPLPALAAPTAPTATMWSSVNNRAAAQPRVDRSAPRAASQKTRHTKPLVLFGAGFTTGGGGASGGSNGDGGGGGVTAALALWLLFSFPGLAVLRLPASRRTPRAPVAEIRVRPG